LSVKSLPRTDAESHRASRNPRGARPTPRPARPGQQPGFGVEGTGTTPGATASNADWMGFSERLVFAWCERFDRAARVAAENARLAGKSPADSYNLDRLPLTLHDDSLVEQAYFVEWPAGVPKELGGLSVGQTAVHYVRLEGRDSPKRIFGYYKHQARRRDGQQVPGGVWIDAYRRAETDGRRLSLDVLITLPGQQSTANVDPDAETGIVVEILAIEAADPARD
jgi:hypothetical protein